MAVIVDEGSEGENGRLVDVAEGVVGDGAQEVDLTAAKSANLVGPPNAVRVGVGATRRCPTAVYVCDSRASHIVRAELIIWSLKSGSTARYP